ncbi:MAG: hypothetical protein JSW36_12125 [Burkholderiales bacterium]|nr:MAG: hypothetical protein JSW36_12125 [Burkholderiales bacterium]
MRVTEIPLSGWEGAMMRNLWLAHLDAAQLRALLRRVARQPGGVPGAGAGCDIVAG